jgi:hypothetical protein
LPIPFRSIDRLIQSVLPQLSFSYYRHQSIRADFCGGQRSPAMPVCCRCAASISAII